MRTPLGTPVHDYEVAVAHGAKRQGFDGVVCGHIHQAANKTIEGISYLNTGDWVESCTAIAEDYDGNFHLIDWLNHPKNIEKQARRQSKLYGTRPRQKELSLTEAD